VERSRPTAHGFALLGRADEVQPTIRPRLASLDIAGSARSTASRGENAAMENAT
jgi:hypothetical protein